MNTDDRAKFEKALANILGYGTHKRDTENTISLTKDELFTLYRQAAKDANVKWDYYQNFVKVHGYESITGMAVAVGKLEADNARLLRLISEISEYLDTDAETTIGCNSALHREMHKALKEQAK